MRAIRREMRAAASPALTVPQLRALLFVNRNPEVNLSKVAEHLGVGVTGASGLVDRLVRHGLLARETDPNERRRIQLTVTPDGRARLDAAVSATRDGSPPPSSRSARTRRASSTRQCPSFGLLRRRTMTSAIETRSLTKTFKEVHAVDSLDLAITAGSIFGLLGPNGAGKTTTIRMLTTLLPPTSGQATVAGFDIVHDAQQVRRSIGYVPQLLSTDGTLTGYENLLVSARLYHLPRGERRDRIAAALSDFGLSDASGRLVRTYSGGMIRRLEMAAAMLHQPRVLFLDEPTLGLDPIARETVWDHLAALRESTNTTVLITTHYMEEADELCDRIAIMDRGAYRRRGHAGELKSALGPERDTR